MNIKVGQTGIYAVSPEYWNFFFCDHLLSLLIIILLHFHTYLVKSWSSIFIIFSRHFLLNRTDHLHFISYQRPWVVIVTKHTYIPPPASSYTTRRKSNKQKTPRSTLHNITGQESYSIDGIMVKDVETGFVL